MARIISNTIQLHVARQSSDGSYEFLALKRSDSDELYPSLWQVITGTSDAGETAVCTALRELIEETSIGQESIEQFWTVPFVGSFFDPYSDSVNMVPVFGVLVSCLAHVRISDEHSDYIWLTSEQISELLPFPSHRRGHEVFEQFVLSGKSGSGFEYRFK